MPHNLRRSPLAHALPAVLLTAILGASAGCGSSGHNRPATSVDALLDADGVQRAEIHLHSFYFEPSRVVVRAGKPVELVLHNHSLVIPHNLTIAHESIAVSKGVGRKRTHRLRFTPSTPGEYPFHCDVGSHSDKGMTGVLVVVP
jgi:plastocyanin